MTKTLKLTTRREIDALTTADVGLAKAKRDALCAANSRLGLPTIDYILAQVDGNILTLDAAKRYLRDIVGGGEG